MKPTLDLAGLRDPMLLNTELDQRARFYPLGFPLDIRTNSQGVIGCAAESWGLFPKLFDETPLEVRVAVTAGDGARPPAPVFRGQEHLVAIVSDATTLAVCDYKRSFGFIRAASAAVEDHAWFRWYFLDAIVYTLLVELYLAPVHAACVARGGCGVLLCGAPGAGKSTLAYACARRGWTFLSDDATMLRRGSGVRRLIGNPYHLRFRDTAAEILPELRGRLARRSVNGKLTIELPASEFPGVKIALEAQAGYIVFLKRGAARNAALARVEPDDAYQRLLRDVPLYDTPVSEQHLEALGELVRAPAFELSYGDLENAVAALESLAGP